MSMYDLFTVSYHYSFKYIYLVCLLVFICTCQTICLNYGRDCLQMLKMFKQPSDMSFQNHRTVKITELFSVQFPQT